MFSIFRKKARPAPMRYDPESQRPVIRSSICTGEKTAGFQDVKTGRYTEITLIRSDADLVDFKERYGITGDIPTIY